MEISVVIPSYNESETIKTVIDKVKDACEKIHPSFEIIVIDDGSYDKTEEVLSEYFNNKEWFRYVKLRKNFGKSVALQIGFEIAKGKYVLTIDGDLQDNPDEIVNLYNVIKANNLDIVCGWRKKRQDPVFKVIASQLFNLVIRIFGDLKIHDINCGLKIYKGEVVKNIRIYGEMHRFIPLIAKNMGYTKIAEIPVIHFPRIKGKSKYTTSRYLAAFLDFLTVLFLYYFSPRPMHFFGTGGLIMFLVGVFISFFLIVDKLYKISKGLPWRNVTDQPLFYLAIAASIIGSNLFLAGFISELLVKIKYETSRTNAHILTEKKVNVDEW